NCVNTLLDYLYYIYWAVFKLNIYYDSWLVSTTLILCKLGKPSYTKAKAYQLIGLLNTIEKLLLTTVATDLSYLTEKHKMLPLTQFGGHSGCNTTDTMHTVVSKIKDA
ncbi:hypothetical protein J132_07471, partial [Termitomyces sp. J132]